LKGSARLAPSLANEVEALGSGTCVMSASPCPRAFFGSEFQPSVCNCLPSRLHIRQNGLLRHSKAGDTQAVVVLGTEHGNWSCEVVGLGQ
jgi:hypothetical protein